MAEAHLTWHLQDAAHSARSQLWRHEAGGEFKGQIGRPFVNSFRTSGRVPANSGNWPGRAKAEFKLAAVNQSTKAGQQGKF
jgi:hypothetical protein